MIQNRTGIELKILLPTFCWRYIQWWWEFFCDDAEQTLARSVYPMEATLMGNSHWSLLHILRVWVIKKMMLNKHRHIGLNKNLSLFVQLGFLKNENIKQNIWLPISWLMISFGWFPSLSEKYLFNLLRLDLVRFSYLLPRYSPVLIKISLGWLMIPPGSPSISLFWLLNSFD